MKRTFVPLSHSLLDELNFIPFDVYDKNLVLLCKKGEMATPKLIKKLLRFELFSYKDEFLVYFGHRNERKNYKNNVLSNFVKDVATKTVANILSKIQDCHPIELSECEEISKALVEETKSAYTKIDSAEQLTLWGNYDYTHPLNVINFSIALGIRYGLNDKELHQLALASLLHDTGKTRLHTLINDKPLLKLTETEKKIYRYHPILSYKIASDEMCVEEFTGKIILYHHENHNGTGFPYGLIENSISIHSHIINVVDFYDNLINGKIDGFIKKPQEALKTLLKEGTSAFHPELLYKFVYMFNYNQARLEYFSDDKLLKVS